MAQAEGFLQVQLDRPMTPEMRLALADILDPLTDHAALLASVQQAVLAQELVQQGILPVPAPRPASPILRPSLQREPLVAYQLDRNTPGVGEFDFVGLRNPTMMNVGDTPAFIVAERDSDLLRAYGIDQLPVPIDGSEGAESVAVPLSRLQIATLNAAPDARISDDVTPVLLNSDGVRSLARLDRDIEVLGQSTRTFELPADAPPTEEQLAALEAAFEEAGLSPPVLTETLADVEVDVGPGRIEQTTADGTCTGEGPGWPFDAASVADIIAHNIEVFGRLGIRRFSRTEVMVVDSGLPDALIEHDTVAPFINVDLAASLAPGRYVRDTGLAKTCTRRTRPPLRHRHGFVAPAGQLGECLDVADRAEIIPPRPSEGVLNYVWDHGGFVGVLAAGGPDLIARADDLDRFVSISFARVMRDDNNALRADPSDVTAAIDFGLRREVPILNLSLRVNEIGDQTIFPKLVEYWRPETGLTVAAAGNSGGVLDANSRAFPASVVASPRDNLIVVGGVEWGPGGTIRAWEQSSRSPTIVDIAAPARAIRSFDGDGNLSCYLGTSVAAPQVSFVAAILHSMGMTRPAAIKRRILATADFNLELVAEERVRDGRVLNAPRALDVFADFLWRRGASTPERVEILGHPAVSGNSFLKLCATGADYNGWIDLIRLHAFECKSGGEARIWRDANEVSGISNLDTTCTPQDDAPLVVRVGATEETITLGEIDRLVPSRFRAAFALDTPPL